MNKKTRQAYKAEKEANSDPRFTGYELVEVGGEVRVAFNLAKAKVTKTATIDTYEVTKAELAKIIAAQGEGPSREKDALKNRDRAEVAMQERTAKGLTAEFSGTRVPKRVRTNEIKNYKPTDHNPFGGKRL